GETAHAAAERLDRAATRALGEGRLYSPEGDSAIEYWLEARRLAPADAAVAGAIAGLQPYLLIGCEQAIARHDFPEARRLHALMTASDPAAPALPRLAAAIASAEANAEADRAEAVRLAAEDARRERRAAETAAADVARTAAAAVSPAQAVSAAAPGTLASTQASAAAPASQAPTPARLPASSASGTPSNVAATPVARPASTTPPRLLHQPPPRYPSLALSQKLEGSVQVAFTIGADGTVSDARVLRADPPGVFERSALAAVGGYRFEPPGRAMPSTVTVRFDLGG
ncbi:MAG TPA: energy transducer TonB, partial [Luteimonas sp.]